MSVIFVGEILDKSSPLLTWKNALDRVGVHSESVDLVKLRTPDWISILLKYDIVVFQEYGLVGEYAKRQLAIGYCDHAI